MFIPVARFRIWIYRVVWYLTIRQISNSVANAIFTISQRSHATLCMCLRVSACVHLMMWVSVTWSVYASACLCGDQQTHTQYTWYTQNRGKQLEPCTSNIVQYWRTFRPNNLQKYKKKKFFIRWIFVSVVWRQFVYLIPIELNVSSVCVPVCMCVCLFSLFVVYLSCEPKFLLFFLFICN